MATIEALYIFDEHNNLILNNVYNGRPTPPSTLLPLYLQQPSPRPSLVYLTSTNPPTLLYSMIQDNLLFLSPSTSDVEPLLVLEFLHRVADALEEFLGSPLLASKITANYDIAAQVLAEIADAGTPAQSEPNALRDVVETGPGVLNNLLGKVGLPGSSPALNSSTPSILPQQPPQQTSAIPWRRSNVRHTSNELYVDMLESLSVTYAPSGRPLAAFANGSIAFTSKVSGVPDLLLNLSTNGKGAGMGTRADQLQSVMERVVFHPCVRLNKWKSDGIISFVPPDGRFALCGYETDLLGPDVPLTADVRDNLNLPAKIDVSTNLGAAGNEFEVRLTLPSSATRSTAATASLQSNLSNSSSGRPSAFRAATTSTSADPKAPALEDLRVHIPLPAGVRNLSDVRASKGEAHFSPLENSVEWKINAKEASTIGAGGAVLKCAIQGPLAEEDGEGENGLLANGMTSSTYDYDDDAPTPKVWGKRERAGVNGKAGKEGRFRELMPGSATVSFSVKGWLASGLKVESLLVDTKKSRGVGAEVKPYKGVKYLTVSRGGVEVRC